MRTVKSLLLLLVMQILVCAQQAPPKPTTPTSRCHGCPRRVAKRVIPPAQVPSSPTPAEFFVGEARVDVTKDETVVRLAMAQHGSVLIELPANDGPRYIMPGDPEMATVDQKALERNKRAIVVRPGTQFVPPLHNLKARTPSATVTAQMRSGLVVTFLFYPVEDLAQNVHRCVLNYNRDEVVARRRAAGLPVNLDGTGERGEMTTQSAAPISISVEDTKEGENRTSAETPVASSTPGPNPNLPVPSPATTRLSSIDNTVDTKDSASYASSAQTALQEAMKQPKRFKNWTKPTHGLALSILRPSVNGERFNVVLVAVKNKTSDSVKLTPDIPDLSIEMLDDRGKPLNIESIKKLHTEASDTTGLIPKGGIVYYAVAYTSPVLSVHQQVRVSVGQTSAADEPASMRLQHFLESKKVASLHLANHQTGTLRDVEARNLTDYLARTILETREHRDHRQSVKSAALEHHGRLVNDFDKASNYHAAARELASGTNQREPQFTDKEKINLEIYAELENDAAERERYLELTQLYHRL